MSSRTLASAAPPASSRTSSTVAVTGCVCDAGAVVAAGLGVVAAVLFEFGCSPPQEASSRQAVRLRRRFCRLMSQSLSQILARLTRRAAAAVGTPAAGGAGLRGGGGGGLGGGGGRRRGG